MNKTTYLENLDKISDDTERQAAVKKEVLKMLEVNSHFIEVINKYGSNS